MVNFKRKLLALLVSISIIATNSVAVLAADNSDLNIMKAVESAKKVEATNEVLRADWTNFEAISGTLGSMTTNTNINVNKNYSRVRVSFATKSIDGGKGAIYKVKLTKSGQDSREFTLYTSDTGGTATIGSLSRGSWSVSIQRQSGSGTYNYAILFYGK